MMQKFTEEQYQTIVHAWDLEDTYAEATQAVVDVISVFVTELLQDEALALANPVTREWAHDKFVEKEKLYVWKLNGLYLVKSIDDGSIFFGSLDASTALSESQVKEWGFNTEMFGREEVQ